MKKKDFRRRLIIGSANFIKNYGANSIKIKNNEKKKILKFLINKKVFKIDTAESYLKNNFYFKNVDKKFKFTTKMNPDYKWVSLDYCHEKIEKHFNKLNGNKIDTWFFHDIDILYTKHGKKIFQNILSLKKKLFLNIGFSIYDVTCLDFLVSNYDVDAIQCPYNLLDQRIINSGWAEKLKKKKIEIHVRSIFLQGLLINNSIYQKKYFNKWKKKFSNWFKWLEVNNVSPLNYCINDLLKHDFDKIVVGINSLDNMKEIINFEYTDKIKTANFQINDIKLIDPRNWK